MPVSPDKPLRLSSRWCHVHLLSADLVGILLLPAISLRRPELSGSKTAFLAVFHAEIFLLGLVAMLDSLSQPTIEPDTILVRDTVRVAPKKKRNFFRRFGDLFSPPRTIRRWW